MIATTALRLVLLAAAIALVLAGIAHLTEPRINANRDRAARAALADLVGDPTLVDRPVEWPPGASFDLCDADVGPTRIVRTRGRGYGGVIEIAIAIGADARLRGVRVVSHRETPGIGDVVETTRSPWIHRFNGLPADAAAAPWSDSAPAVDAITGATITSRAVVEAVRQKLLEDTGLPCRP